MRLAQLARKLSVRPSQIVDLLAQEQIFVEDGSNAKLNDDVVRKVLQTLAPTRLSELMAEQVLEAEPEAKAIPESKISDQEQLNKFESEPVAEISAGNSPEEIIRAPKVELAGLKVLGKIELPQRKQEEIKEKTEPAEPVLKREQRERRPRQQHEGKSWRNPIALQREQEARENEERRQAALKKEKERKQQHYLARGKPPKPIKAMRIYDESVQEQIQIAPETKPRTWFGKFVKWLNT